MTATIRPTSIKKAAAFRPLTITAYKRPLQSKSIDAAADLKRINAGCFYRSMQSTAFRNVALIWQTVSSTQYK